MARSSPTITALLAFMTVLLFNGEDDNTRMSDEFIDQLHSTAAGQSEILPTYRIGEPLKGGSRKKVSEVGVRKK